jgi:hypothetical protein
MVPSHAQCLNFVTTYTPAMIEWIQTHENPQTFCVQIGMCEPPKTAQRQAGRGTVQDSKRLRLKQPKPVTKGTFTLGMLTIVIFFLLLF